MTNGSEEWAGGEVVGKREVEGRALAGGLQSLA